MNRMHIFSTIRKLLTLRWQFFVVFTALLSIGVSLTLGFLDYPFSDWPLIVAIVLGGIPLTIQIVYQIFHGELGVDALAAIAVITAVILHEHLAATLVILMLSGGQTLESYAVRQASSALLALSERMPSMVHLSKDNKILDVPLLNVSEGSEVVIYPHETCPVDGVVIEGHGSMDESYLTGEPYHMSKAPGAYVLSGAVNGETVLKVRTTRRPEDSRYAAIVKVLEEAEQKKPNLRRLGDQIGAWFTPIALIFASCAWYITGDATRFLSVLVIATPCPLLIAIPITLISAISIASRRAIIIKDPTVLERLPTCTTAIFDKTGTLTYGKPTLTEIHPAQAMDKDFILQQAASLERYSKHPLASALLEAAYNRQMSLLDASSVMEKPGQGLVGEINGHQIHITHRKQLLASQPEAETLLPPLTSGLECIVLYDNQYAATMTFHDVPRSDSKSFINHLQPYHQFNKIMLVSGDRESEVQYFGKLLNITELYPSQTPEQKLAIVNQETQHAATLFMGDGINDAPALTAATVGIAFGQYSNVTAESAGVIIMDNTFNKVDELFHLSLITRKIALQSAVGGMVLSLIGMGFAAAGFITPVAGAILQEIIDLVAILNALRLTWTSTIRIDLSRE